MVQGQMPLSGAAPPTRGQEPRAKGRLRYPGSAVAEQLLERLVTAQVAVGGVVDRLRLDRVEGEQLAQHVLAQLRWDVDADVRHCILLPWMRQPEGRSGRQAPHARIVSAAPKAR